MKRKAIVLFLAMAALLALPSEALAQYWNGGLFSNQKAKQNTEGLMNQREANEGLTLGGTQNEDPTVPLNNGIAILLAASMGYVALKKKEDQQ